MVDRGEMSGFFLPPKFLDDEQMIGNLFDAEIRYPGEFPYGGNAGGEMSCAASQSTLTRLGSFSGRASVNESSEGFISPPATPLAHTAVEDLIHQQVGVGRSGFVCPKVHIEQPRDFQRRVGLERCDALWYGQHQVAADRKITGHVSRSGPTRIPGTRLGGGPNHGGGRKACAGTGVFLPRRYDNDEKALNSSAYASDSATKTGYYASELTYVGNVHQPHHMSNHHYSVSIKSPQQSPSNYEISMARRKALMLLQQKRAMMMMLMEDSSLINRGIYLPHEWTY